MRRVDKACRGSNFVQPASEKKDGIDAVRLSAIASKLGEDVFDKTTIAPYFLYAIILLHMDMIFHVGLQHMAGRLMDVRAHAIRDFSTLPKHFGKSYRFVQGIGKMLQTSRAGKQAAADRRDGWQGLRITDCAKR